MAERGTFLGEVQEAARRFWGLQWKVKGPILGVAAFIILAVIAGATGDGESPSAADPFETATPTATATNTPKREATQKPTATATSTPEPTATPTPEPTARPTRTPTSTPTPKPMATPTPEEVTTIPGLTAADIKLNLEQRGFECSGPDTGETMLLWSCRSFPYNVDWMGPSPTRLRSVSATAIDNDEAARQFLGFIATLPYDDATPLEARAWVEEHIGTDTETTFGSARFLLYGPQGARSLDIVAVDAE